MANNEIHNYVNEQTTPTYGDFMDLDADQGGGNYLSKKMTLSNLRKWLFKWVNQDSKTLEPTNEDIFIANDFNVYILNISTDGEILPLIDSEQNFTQVLHIHNLNGSEITISNSFLTTADNPPITTTVGGYAQVWITNHKKGLNEFVKTANTINFI